MKGLLLSFVLLMCGGFAASAQDDVVSVVHGSNKSENQETVTYTDITVSSSVSLFNDKKMKKNSEVYVNSSYKEGIITKIEYLAPVEKNVTIGGLMVVREEDVVEGK